MTRPNARITRIGHTLLDHYAQAVEQAFEHLALAISLCDGQTRGDLNGRNTGPATPTEAAIIAAEQQTEKAERLKQAINAVDNATNTLGHVIGTILPPTPPAAQAKRCADGQIGRDGALEWGDPTCEELPTKAGLHAACYLREWRWRKAHNLIPRDIEPEPGSNLDIARWA